MGPTDFNTKDVYLRTAVSVDPTAGPLRLREDARLPLGHLPRAAHGSAQDRLRRPLRRAGVWQQVPGEYRNWLRRLIVTQADTEPASVEQQRLLGHTAPSLYDLRNLFQVNVEEGRHLWAMVYLLHTYFGKDGREEADELLQRRSGNADTRASWARSTSPAWTGCRSSASRCSPTATASSSS
jgi:benzoyl-CoA 2,3-dioxygenase component B